MSSIAWFAYQYAPLVQGFLDKSFGNKSATNYENKALQPLYKVFYKFSHRSGDDWVKWILNENEETRKLAFDQLKAHLESPAEQFGLATKEVIKAVAAFKRYDSLEILSNLFNSIRPRLGQLKSIDLFFEDLCLSVTKLDPIQGVGFLKNELHFLDTNQPDGLNFEEFKVAVIKALASVEFLPQDLLDFFVTVITNKTYSSRLRKELIKLIIKRAPETHEYVYTEVLKTQLQSGAQVLSKEYQDVLSELFNSSKSFIRNGNDVIWGLLIQLCYAEGTQELFTLLLIDTITNPNDRLNDKQLQSLLETEPPLRDIFKAALMKLNALTEAEMSLLKGKIREEDLVFESDVLLVERSKKTKTVTSELLKEYHILEETLSKDGKQTNRAERKSSHTIKLITGTGEEEKIYLLRALASNINKTFVYIDMPRIILSSADLNKLISTISNSKPAIVFLDRTFEILTRDLSERESEGLKTMLKALRELSILPTVSFWAGLNIDSLSIPNYPELSGIISSGIRGAFKPVININTPDLEAKSRIFKGMLSKVSPGKIEEGFQADDLLHHVEKLSMLHFCNYLIDFFESSLMLYGKISKTIKQAPTQASTQTQANQNTTTLSEDTIKEVEKQLSEPVQSQV